MRNRLLRNSFLLFGALAFSAGPTLAQGRGWGQQKKQEKAEEHEAKHSQGYYFSTRDREVITEYYRGRSSQLPPGLAKRGGNLPPGLERQLQRNGHLPPGIEKRFQPVPVELERMLPPLPPNCRRVVVGSDLLIVNVRAQIILDVFRGAVVLGVR